MNYNSMNNDDYGIPSKSRIGSPGADANHAATALGSRPKSTRARFGAH